MAEHQNSRLPGLSGAWYKNKAFQNAMLPTRVRNVATTNTGYFAVKLLNRAKISWILGIIEPETGQFEAVLSIASIWGKT
jgi:hypothetical protein